MNRKQASYMKEVIHLPRTTPQEAAAMGLTTLAGAAAMEEFGFVVVDLNQFGGPTPGRVADRLCDITAKLKRLPVARSDFIEVTEELRRLTLALDAWDAAIFHLWELKTKKLRKPRPPHSR